MPFLPRSLQTVRGRIARFRELSAPERRIVLVAGLAFPLVAAALRVWGLDTVQDFLLRRPLVGASREKLGERQVIEMVETTARVGIRKANCLERSLVLMWILRSFGTATDLRIGARRDGDEMLFHAWLEEGGRVLNDDPAIGSRYAAFDAAIVPRTMRLA